MDSVKFVDLKPVGHLAGLINTAYDRVFNSGNYIGGREVEMFERAWAEYCGAKYCIGVGNGHDALEIACSYLAESFHPIKPGIVTPWKTCIPTWSAAKKSCVPSVDPDSGVLSIAVHIYGQVTLPKTYKADKMVEDCAQAHGATFNGVKAGKFGKAAAWSFYPTKNLGALGDAGAITTDDPEVAYYAFQMRNYGKRDDIGINSRMDPLQAAFLRAKLPYLDSWNQTRTENAQTYTSWIIPDGKITLPTINSEDDHPCWHIFAIETDDRDELRYYLHLHNVETMIHYPSVPYPSHFEIKEAERWTERTLSLPVGPHVTPYVCKQIAMLINHWIQK